MIIIIYINKSNHVAILGAGFAARFAAPPASPASYNGRTVIAVRLEYYWQMNSGYVGQLHFDSITAITKVNRCANSHREGLILTQFVPKSRLAANHRAR